jgi:hypothetical protein
MISICRKLSRGWNNFEIMVTSSLCRKLSRGRKKNIRPWLNFSNLSSAVTLAHRDTYITSSYSLDIYSKQRRSSGRSFWSDCSMTARYVKHSVSVLAFERPCPRWSASPIIASNLSPDNEIDSYQLRYLQAGRFYVGER